MCLYLNVLQTLNRITSNSLDTVPGTSRLDFDDEQSR